MPFSPLLSAAEPPAYTCVNPQGRSKTLLICDHASNRIPLQLGTLGLTPADLESHIAWDPGAAAVARCLSALLDAPLLLSGYSRLVIDCNRPLANPTSIPDTSAGIDIPGNRGLNAEQRRQRVDALFLPYHRAIETTLETGATQFQALLSLHSFTPILCGSARPWVIGVASRQQRAFAQRLIQHLRHCDIGPVGDDEPYAIDDSQDYSLPAHGESRGLPHAMVEIRQDGLREAASAQRWAERLAAVLG
jgi:predicted N-formylglutamate amidohydrolase